MDPIVLHHYPTSTFSERVRLAFGLKQLAWRSVAIPPAMPKPDLLPLTGGYRRTPVMQIGANIYCDTQLILRKIESLHPEPSLYPDGSEGIVLALAWWADKTIFAPALGVVADTIGEKIPPAVRGRAQGLRFSVGPRGCRAVDPSPPAAGRGASRLACKNAVGRTPLPAASAKRSRSCGLLSALVVASSGRAGSGGQASTCAASRLV